MKDIDHNKLNLGDRVATTIVGYHYSLQVGTITGFTPKKVRLEFADGGWALKEPRQVALLAGPGSSRLEAA